MGRARHDPAPEPGPAAVPGDVTAGRVRERLAEEVAPALVRGRSTGELPAAIRTELQEAPAPPQPVSASSSSRSCAKQPLSRRETCIWEIPSCCAIRLCVMPRKNLR